MDGDDETHDEVVPADKYRARKATMRWVARRLLLVADQVRCCTHGISDECSDVRYTRASLRTLAHALLESPAWRLRRPLKQGGASRDTDAT